MRADRSLGCPDDTLRRDGFSGATSSAAPQAWHWVPRRLEKPAVGNTSLRGGAASQPDRLCLHKVALTVALGTGLGHLGAFDDEAPHAGVAESLEPSRERRNTNRSASWVLIPRRIAQTLLEMLRRRCLDNAACEHLRQLRGGRPAVGLAGKERSVGALGDRLQIELRQVGPHYARKFAILSAAVTTPFFSCWSAPGPGFVWLARSASSQTYPARRFARFRGCPRCAAADRHAGAPGYRAGAFVTCRSKGHLWQRGSGRTLATE